MISGVAALAPTAPGAAAGVTGAHADKAKALSTATPVASLTMSLFLE
jgi:hypothetical protein